VRVQLVNDLYLSRGRRRIGYDKRQP
jgi:hypothetical protein